MRHSVQGARNLEDASLLHPVRKKARASLSVACTVHEWTCRPKRFWESRTDRTKQRVTLIWTCKNCLKVERT